jgi:nucleotide-binding universal stress UspA family protein
MNILVGYDGSESSRRALEKAVELANGGTVTCVAADRVLCRGSPLAVSPIALEDHTAALAEAEKYLADRNVPCRTLHFRGDPADVITAEALREHADLVIIGCEHKNLLERLLLGSVSDTVMHQAKTNVLVVA